MIPLRLLFCWAAVVAGMPAAGAAEVRVFAAASLSDALREVAPLYTAATGDVLVFNFGASGTLARQIKEGAPADVIFPADEMRMDQLEAGGLLLEGTRRPLLANSLVLIVPAEGGADLAGLHDLALAPVRRVAIGEPATVPAGTYAKQHLIALGLWGAIEAKLVPLDNVRAVLAAVASGNVDAGFVYRTDALISRDVKIAVEVPVAEGPRITYPIAVLREAKQADKARAFIAFLATNEIQAVFARLGFRTDP